MRLKGKSDNVRDGIAAPRCAIYCRSAIRFQSGKRNAVHPQLLNCKAFIKRPRPLQWQMYSKEYIDHGFSGMSESRPAMRHLLSDAAKGKFQIVVCDRICRLSRDVSAAVQLLERLAQHGVSVYTCA
jgi:site-specific DNA recombinase